jgi:hypothetical protein
MRHHLLARNKAVISIHSPDNALGSLQAPPVEKPVDGREEDIRRNKHPSRKEVKLAKEFL